MRGGDRASIVDGVGIDRYVASWQLTDTDGTPLKPDEVPLARALMYGEKNSREFVIRSDDHEDVVVLGNAAPVKDGDETIAAVVVFTDITERKRAELERNETAARLQALLDNAPYGAHMYELTPDDRLVFVGYNQRAVSMLGLDHEQFMGMTLEEAFPGNVGTDTPDNYRRIAREGGTWQTEQFAYDDDHGIAGVFEVYAFSYGPRRVAVFFRDVTDIKKAETELQSRTEELERSNAELEKFAYVASHDLQEPLRMVASYTQLLQQRYAGRLDSDADEFIGYAVDGATRMRTLINDLLAYSRVGTQGSPMVETDLEVVFGDVMADLRAALEESGATVTHDPLPTLRCDPSQIGRVFLNLVSNAAKFRGSDPPLIHAGVRREGDDWVFSVRDNGIGIDPQYFDRVFVIFQRLESRAKYPGTGIGLAISKRIISRHGGRMWVESQPGAGSTFFFTLRADEEVSHG
jgi:PAS domain S-box-containing protein